MTTEDTKNFQMPKSFLGKPTDTESRLYSNFFLVLGLILLLPSFSPPPIYSFIQHPFIRYYQLVTKSQAPF